jgi:hypothetical protein
LYTHTRFLVIGVLGQKPLDLGGRLYTITHAKECVRIDDMMLVCLLDITTLAVAGSGRQPINLIIILHTYHAVWPIYEMDSVSLM